MIFQDLIKETPLSKAQKLILDEIQKIIQLTVVGSFLIDETFFEKPPQGVSGDIAFSCFKLDKELKSTPQEVAEKIQQSFKPTELVEKTEVKGPYLNFYLNRQVVSQIILDQISKEKDGYGNSKVGKSKRVMIEYSSPNTNKPQHIGHIRNNLLGWTTAKLLQTQGFKVFKTSIVNDRGIHICKSMLAYQKWGEGKTPEDVNKKSDHFVGDFYVLYSQHLAKEEKEFAQKEGINLASLSDDEKRHFNERFFKNSKLMQEARELLQKWEAGDKETRALWQKMNNWAYQGFDKTYKDLGVDFNKVYYESEIYQGGKEVIENGIQTGKLEKQKDGSVIARLDKHGLPDKVVIRSDGTSVYITQDVNLAQIKFSDFKLDYSIYCVASEQDLYFKQLFKILELIDFPGAGNLYHLSYNMVNLPSGKMKSREGVVVDADDLISEMVNLSKDLLKQRYPELAEDEIEKRSWAIGLSAIKFYILGFKNNTLITFDPQKSLAFEGKTGPYLQYTYARACSVLKKANQKVKLSKTNNIKITDEEWSLLKIINEFPQSVFKAGINTEPVILVDKIYEIAETFNHFYHSQPILKADEEKKKFRLMLTQATKQVLGNGLKLLGITPIEEM